MSREEIYREPMRCGSADPIRDRCSSAGHVLGERGVDSPRQWTCPEIREGAGIATPKTEIQQKMMGAIPASAVLYEGGCLPAAPQYHLSVSLYSLMKNGRALFDPSAITGRIGITLVFALFTSAPRQSSWYTDGDGLGVRTTRLVETGSNPRRRQPKRMSI